MVSFTRDSYGRRRVAFATAMAGVFAAISIALADPGSPVSLTNVDAPDPVVSGAEITYTFTARNNGGAKVDNVVLTDQLNGVGGIGVPPQFVVTSSRGSCTQTVDLVTCNAGQMEGGGTWVVTVRGKVTAPSGATLNNTASISFQKSAQNFTTTSTSTTLVQGGGGGTELADLSVDKTGPTFVPVNSPMTYTVIVNNTGAANATGVKVVDTLPLGLSNVTHATTSLFVCTNDEPALPHPPAVITVTCEGGLINAGANGTITINALSPEAAGPITNTASVDPDNTVQENNELNNTSAIVNTSVGAPPPQGPITIVKTDVDIAGPDWTDGAGPDPVVPGAILTYKVLVTNTSPFRADDVRLVDGTQGLAASSMTINQVVTNGAVGTQGGCAVDAPQLTCQIRSLNAGGTVLYTITGQIVASAGSTLINTGTVSGNIRNTAHSATATELTTVRPAIDLTVTKTDEKDPVPASSWPTTAEGGAEPPPPFVAPPPMQPWAGKLLAPPVGLGGVHYTITVGNSGMFPATGVLVRDQLPGGTIFDHVSGDVAPAPGGFTCALAPGNILNCSGGTVGAASIKKIEVFVVAPPFVGTIVNSVVVDPINTIFEADETNNGAVQGTTISTGVDLTLVKDDKGPNSPQGFDPIATAGTQTYIITVDNIGPQSVSNVRVRDVLPAGTTFRNAQGDSGFTCSHANGIVDCVGAYMPGTFEEFYTDAGEHKATITIKIFAQNIVGIMHNEARVDPDNQIPEINEQNNFDFEDTLVEDNGPGAFNDLEIKKEATPTTTPGGPITYTIKVWNTGSDPAPNVTVRDVLPAGVTFVSAVDAGGPGSPWTCGHAAGVVTCNGATIEKNTVEATARKITIVVTAPNQIITLTNLAQVDPFNAIPEGSEQDNTSTAETQVESLINLIIKKTGPPTSTQSQPAQYVITIKNDGGGGAGQTAFDVEMHDPLPVGVIPLAIKIESAFDNPPAPPPPPNPPPDNWACQITQNAINVVDCQGDLIPYQMITITIDVFMTAETGKSVENEACVDPDDVIKEFGPGESDNCSTHVSVVVPKSPNLTLTKTAAPSQVQGGEELVYTLLIQNIGDATAIGTAADAGKLKITDSLPSAVTFVNADATGVWTCTFIAPTVTCLDDGTGLAPGAASTITIRTSVNPSPSAPIVNVANATSPAQTADVDAVPETSDHLDDNTGKVTTSIGGSPFDLVLSTVTDNPDPVAPGQTLKYTIVAVNAGTQDADPVKIVIQLPNQASATFDNADGSNGFNCTAPDLVSNVLTCEGPLPAGGDTTITVTVNVLLGLDPPPDLTLTATIDPVSAALPNGAWAEANEGNNTETETTTVSGTTCFNCVDLVTTELTATPGVLGSATTFTARVVNVGDQATGLDAATQPLVRLPDRGGDGHLQRRHGDLLRSGDRATVHGHDRAPAGTVHAVHADLPGQPGAFGRADYFGSGEWGHRRPRRDLAG